MCLFPFLFPSINNRSVDKKNLAEEVQTTRPILNIYFFGEFTFSLALSDSHVNCPSSGDNTKPLAKIEGYISLYTRMLITKKVRVTTVF